MFAEHRPRDSRTWVFADSAGADCQRWLVTRYATHLHGSVDDDIAVIIESAHPSSTAPLVLSSLGLTRRESEVALLVLRGASTKAIGAELHLSAYTVKDHLKSIFDKTGVRSRRDLVAQVLTGRV